jgi:hypothetical protein
LSVREMKTLQRQRPFAFNAESRGLPEAAWVFSWRQMDCLPSSPAKASLREGVQEEDFPGRCSSQVFPYLEQPSKGYERYMVVTGFSYFVMVVG